MGGGGEGQLGGVLTCWQVGGGGGVDCAWVARGGTGTCGADGIELFMHREWGGRTETASLCTELLLSPTWLGLGLGLGLG